MLLPTLTLRGSKETPGESVKLSAVRERSEINWEGTHLLVATGRTPNTQGIG